MIRRFIEFSIDKPLLNHILLAFIVLPSIFAYSNIPKEIFPPMNKDKIVVTGAYAGTSADVLDKMVLNTIEDEMQNIEVVKTVCNILDELVPSKLDSIIKYEQLITYVGDRAGHDVRYAIDATKIANELNWTPDETFATGIKKTIEWYLKNTIWCDRVKDGSYQGERLGVINNEY